MRLVDPASVPGIAIESDVASGVTVKVLLSGKDGAPTFSMRHFRLAPGGNTPYHDHAYEHEVFCLEGSLVARHADGTTTTIEAGQAVLVTPGELHGFVNEGSEDAVFLCLVPKGVDAYS